MRWVRAFVLLLSAAAVVVAQDAPKRRNAIVFVADGLRHGSVNAIDTPALYRIRTDGVYRHGDQINPTLFPRDTYRRTNRAVFTKLQYLFRYQS